jgi:hypothetical protein
MVKKPWLLYVNKHLRRVIPRKITVRSISQFDNQIRPILVNDPEAKIIISVAGSKIHRFGDIIDAIEHDFPDRVEVETDIRR